MTDIGIRDISVSFRDNKISNISLVQGDALTRGFDITFVNAKGEVLPPDDDYIVELIAVNSKDKDTPYACRHEIVDDKYRVMIPTEALSESGSVTIQLVFYQKSTKAVIHTIKQKCPVYQSIGQEFVESNNLYVDITALRLGLERIDELDSRYESMLGEEKIRQDAEDKRNLDEAIRKDNESIRKANENKRENNEVIRIDNENKRVSAEAEREEVFADILEVDSTGSPGEKYPIKKHTPEIEFYGEVLPEKIIKGDELALKIGLSAGFVTNNTSSWLKFKINHKIIFIAKKHLRKLVSWSDLDEAGLVYGDKIIEIKGLKYKIRLLRGIGEDVQPDPKELNTNFAGKACHNSEWNAVFCPISDKAPYSWEYPENVKSPTVKMAKSYSNSELEMGGTRTWCQETAGTADNSRAYRGDYGVSYSHSALKTVAHSGFGWRPVLELVE